MLEVKKSTVSEIEAAPNFSELLAEYAKELVVEGAPPFSAKLEMYHQLENLGALQVFGAFFDNALIGLVTVLVTILPHCGVMMAVTESLFVFREFRGTGAGLKLIRVAEDNAKERGSPCLLISAPFGGDLAEVLPHVGYTETNRVFFRNLKDA
jgi:GNAT superfamily N-acetyltransferase